MPGKYAIKMASRYLFLFISYLIINISQGDELCNDYLLPSIPDTHIASTSSLVPRGGNAYTGPERGRLNTTQTTLSNGTILMGGWAPAADNKGQYIQATFDGLTYIEKIVTQGQTPGGGFVKLYKLEYTEDGKTWKSMVSSSLGVEQLFRGNDDSDTPVEGELDCPVFAKGIRIIPLEWESHIALRFDVKGCYVDNSVKDHDWHHTSSAGPDEAVPVSLTKPPPITTKVTTPSSTPVTTPTTSSTPTTPVTTPTPSTSTPSTRKTTKTTSVTTTPLTTLSSTTPPFLPGILTPFGGPPTSPVTTLTQGSTNPPTTTINLLTLIHWFLTALSNSSTTTAATTPLTTTSSTRPSTILTTPTTTTPLTTTKPTTVKTTTTIPPFMPGIPNPFGTTKRP